MLGYNLTQSAVNVTSPRLFSCNHILKHLIPDIAQSFANNNNFTCGY